jgi:hypothetical protein
MTPGILFEFEFDKGSQIGVATPLADYYQNYIDIEGSAALGLLVQLRQDLFLE